ncbi:MAG: acylphosphatase [Nitrososphaerota archaeon]|nr:acylphosphatase [Nitrososphaerota archaeon]
MKARITMEGSEVQDIGYRLFLMGKAKALRGFEAFNEGSAVTALVEGEEGSVKDFTKMAKEEAPPGARVSRVRVEGYHGHVMALRDFREQFNSEQLVKIAVTGVEMKGDIKEMKVDVKEIKGDIKEMKVDVKEIKGDIKEMKVDVKEIKGDIKEMKVDVKEIKGDAKDMLGKQDETNDEISGFRSDLKSWMEPRLSRLERDVGLIKEKMGLG